MSSQAFAIRPATEADAPAISRLINEAQLNPLDLNWRRFLVAHQASEIVGCAQVRVHGGGSRELASVAVTAQRRGGGIGRAISEAAIDGEPTRPLYLYTESRTVAFWQKFAFREIGDREVPGDMRGSLRIARIATRIFSIVRRSPIRIVVMRRDEG